MRAASLIAVLFVSGCVGIAENAEGNLGAGYQPLPGGSVAAAVGAPMVAQTTFGYSCPDGASLILAPNGTALCGTPAVATLSR